MEIKTYTPDKQLRWAWQLTRGYRWQTAMNILLGTLSLLFGLSFIYASKSAVDIATGAASGSLRTTAAAIVASVVLGLLTGQWASWLAERVRIRMTIALQQSLVASQMRTLWEDAGRWHTGDLLVRVGTDSREVVQMVAVTFPSLCVTLLRLLASLSFLWMIDPVLAGMILVISPLFLFSKLYYRKMRSLSKEVKEMESRVGVVLQENLKQRLLIRGLRLLGVCEEKYRSQQEKIKEVRDKQLHFSVLTQTLLKCTFNGGYLLAFLWGIFRLHAGLISFGTLTAFLQLVGRIQNPVLAIIAFVPAAIRCRAAIDRLMELYEGEREDGGKPFVIPCPLCLTFQSVGFRYESREVFDRFSAIMHPGVPTAIAGATGRGKTTLIRLLLALVRPERGQLGFLSWTGSLIPLSAHTRTNFLYVPQGNTLFSGTIRENLLMAVPTASDAQLEEALHIACAEFAYSLPQGLYTLVGESGHGLSEGQAQRIAIARSLLHCDSSVWLFDEPTSALDSATAGRLTENLLKAGEDKILIFVTHDSRLMGACSQVIRI